jgi:hypothetical protein
MKLESLVIVDQHATVKLYPNLVHTARHILEAGFVWNYFSNIFLFSIIDAKPLNILFKFMKVINYGGLVTEVKS